MDGNLSKKLQKNVLLDKLKYLYITVFNSIEFKTLTQLQ